MRERVHGSVKQSPKDYSVFFVQTSESSQSLSLLEARPRRRDSGEGDMDGWYGDGDLARRQSHRTIKSNRALNRMDMSHEQAQERAAITVCQQMQRIDGRKEGDGEHTADVPRRSPLR